MGDAGILGGLIEIFGVGIADARLVAGLPREPEEERLVRAKNAANRRLRQQLAGRGTGFLVQLGLEGARLLDMEALEGFVARAGLEAQDSLSRPLNCGVIGALRIPKKGQVSASLKACAGSNSATPLAIA
jgi:hypothetical protein